jgi:diguanylate cyclase (GGDEF)-like protein/PAS domain S-box-containing protein
MAEQTPVGGCGEGAPFRTILGDLYDGVYVVDLDQRITYWNAGAERLSGFAASEVLGKQCGETLLSHADEHGRFHCKSSCPLKQTLADGQPREVELYLRHKEGHWLPVLVRVTALRDSDGCTQGAVEVFSDNSFMQVAARRIRELEQIALLDPLTGIGNRRFVEMTLNARLSEARRYGWSLGVLFIDIDNFKRINDLYGHDVGDMVLKMVTSTVGNSLRPFDLVARWGGEEFIALLINVHQQELRSIAERARSLVEVSGLVRGPDVIRVTVSIGATVGEPDDTLGKVVKRADRLMYRSKARGRNCVSTDLD